MKSLRAAAGFRRLVRAAAQGRICLSGHAGSTFRRRTVLVVVIVSTPTLAVGRDEGSGGGSGGTDVRQVKVPAGLAKVTTTPELSGLAFAEALDRYLVLSDDAGRAGRKHAPCVFTMDRAGRLDAAPLLIAGIRAIDDGEALGPGPDGTFVLVTSHSPNKRGKIPAARRQILQLTLRGRSLAVVGSLDLTLARSPSLAGAAGLVPDTPVDIEGAAWFGGDLLLGLRAPVRADGSAVILRLANAARAFRHGRVPPGAVSSWAAPRLCVPGPEGEACQGIADLMALGDGRYLVAANAPKGAAPDGGGALWIVGGTPLAATLWRRFAGLKPEGIAHGAAAGRIVVVFDADRGTPRFAEIDAPPAPARKTP